MLELLDALHKVGARGPRKIVNVFRDEMMDFLSSPLGVTGDATPVAPTVHPFGTTSIMS